MRILALLLCVVAPLAADDVILKAMRDELARSRALRIVDLNSPYYIEYQLDDGETFTVTATLGSLVQSRKQRFRIPRVQVRVGSLEFDNTNYVFTGFFGGTRLADQITLDNDPLLLRTWFWLATDHAYKGAVEAIARKRAALRNLTQTETIPDFAKSEPLQKIWEDRRSTIDQAAWTAQVRSLSSVFSGHDAVMSSGVEFETSQSTSHMVNSEGTEIRYPDGLAAVRVRASGQAPDGMPVRDAVVFQALNVSRLPSALDLARGVDQVARNVSALTAAKAGESYTGPVLFEGIAAAQIFADTIGVNLALTRRPVAEPGRPVPVLSSEFEGRIGSRVLPEWIDIVDDPTQSEWRGRPLFGFYDVDSEGVIPKPLSVVEKGVLKNVLMTRQPVRGLSGSNGRARLPGPFGANAAYFGNLFIRASQTTSEADLKKKLIELCQQRNKPYGLIVRKMDFPSSASGDELRRIASTASQSGGARPASLPLMVYKIDATGKEELIRGLRLRGFNTRSFRDILAASDELYAFDFMANGALFSLMGAGGYVAPASVVAPSVLFEDIELDRPQEEQPKLPLVPPPPLIGR